MFLFTILAVSHAHKADRNPRPNIERLQGSNDVAPATELPPTEPTPTSIADVSSFMEEATRLGAGHSRLEAAAVVDCDLGFGYDAATSMCKSSPLSTTQVVGACTGTNIFATCLKHKTSVTNHYYTATVSDERTRQAQTDTIVSASGAGWGVSASSSAEFTSDHMESGYSVSYFIGQMTDQYFEELQAPRGLQLTQAAKDLLDVNPSAFLTAYGKYFVAKIQYGSEFIGSVTLSRRTTGDSSALSVLASLSAEGVYGNAEASTEYNRAVSSHRESLNVRAEARYNGETLGFNGEMPQAMGHAFHEWRDNLVNGTNTEGSVATRIVYRPWYDLADVQAIINRKPDWISTFTASAPNTEVYKLLSKEYIMNKADQNTLLSINNWDCVSGTVGANIQALRDQTMSHAAALDALDDSGLLARTNEVLRTNFTWFTAYEGKTIHDARIALAGATGCKQTETTGTVDLDWFADEHPTPVAFPAETCSNCLMTGLKFTTDKFNLVSVEGKGNDIGLQVIPAVYTHIVRGCVNYHNIIKYPNKSVEECKVLCDANTACLAFEYGVNHGASGGYKPRDCQLQDSANAAACDGARYNLDLYVKAAQSHTVASIGPITYGTRDTWEANCPHGSYITGIEVVWGGIVPLYYHRAAKGTDHEHPKNGNAGMYGAQPDIESCARAVRDGCDHNRVMWAPGTSENHASWGCRCAEENAELVAHNKWNVYRVEDILHNAHGNLQAAVLKCKSLPPRTYRLPTAATTSPVVTLINRPDSVLHADCPDGSVLRKMRFRTQSSGDHLIGPLVKSFDLECRRLSDYW